MRKSNTYPTQTKTGATAKYMAAQDRGVPLSSKAVQAAAELGFQGLVAAAWPELTVRGEQAVAVVAALEAKFGPLCVGNDWSDRTGDHLQFRLPPEGKESAGREYWWCECGSSHEHCRCESTVQVS